MLEMTPLTRFFNFLASPDVAVLLVMAGLLGLYVEFQQPGMILPGVAGAICLVLAAIAFQILPFSWVGLLLMLLGMALVATEVFVTVLRRALRGRHRLLPAGRLDAVRPAGGLAI